MKGNISPEIFREYDIRGDAERDLTDDVVEAIGRVKTLRKGGSSPSFL